MIRSVARQALPIVTGTFALCCIGQIFLAGLGVFDDPAAFVTHREFGYLFGWLTLLALVLALLGREPRRVTGLTVLLLVLFALQSVLVALRADMPVVAALHPLNGFAILGAAAVATRLAWATRLDTAAAPAAGSVAAPAATPGAG